MTVGISCSQVLNLIFVGYGKHSNLHQKAIFMEWGRGENSGSRIVRRFVAADRNA